MVHMNKSVKNEYGGAHLEKNKTQNPTLTGIFLHSQLGVSANF